ncbi:MAG: UDP-3-O-[3-hydroxymyristoyl] glucosamine N-acyltransferase [Planctomycetota bacterium]|jgi:UDP-3-O-[3-hydroxymyristoyl] glucosamine N-acyltransferase
MDSYLTADIAALVDGKIVGDAKISVNGANSLDRAQPGQISFFDDPKLQEAAKNSKAGVLVCSQAIEGSNATLIVVDKPRIAFAKILRTYFAAKPKPKGIHERAYVDPSASVGADPDIAPMAVVGARAKVGNRVRLESGVVVGDDCVLGDDVTLHQNVSVRAGCVLGNRVEIQDGTVIGSDGFGYVQNQGQNEKVPQLGNVVIEDDVEIGSNTTVDRAAFGETRIGANAKIDNLVQVAHNVHIGSSTIIISQVGISGSTKIGSHCMIGGQAGIIGHINITDRVMIGGQSGVTKDVKKSCIISGSPAVDHAKTLRAQVMFPKLPAMKAELKRLAAEMKDIQTKIENL